MCFQKFTFNQEHTKHRLESETLPREFISHWLHRCFPTAEMLLEASWTRVRQQLSAHQPCSCFFLPSLVDNDDKNQNFHHHPRSQAPEIPSQPALLSPQSPPKLLIESEELLEQPMCTFDSWYRSKNSQALIKTAAEQKCLLETYAGHGTVPKFLQTSFSMRWVSPPAKAPVTPLWCSLS